MVLVRDRHILLFEPRDNLPVGRTERILWLFWEMSDAIQFLPARKGGMTSVGIVGAGGFANSKELGLGFKLRWQRSKTFTDIG